MKLSGIFIILSSCALSLSVGGAFEGRVPAQTTVAKTVVQKVARAAGDVNQAGNMTVAFVPLISIIANLLPRFFNRYATAPSPNVQHARALSQAPHYMCQAFDHVGMRWPDFHSSSIYYQCVLSYNCPNTQQARCFMIQQRQCGPLEAFDAGKLKCF